MKRWKQTTEQIEAIIASGRPLEIASGEFRLSNDHVTVVSDQYGFLTFTVTNAVVHLDEICISVDKFRIGRIKDVRIRIRPYYNGKPTTVIIKDGGVTIEHCAG